MISVSAVLMVLLWLVVLGLCFWLLQWAIRAADPPQPWRKVADVVLIVVAVAICICLLLSLVGGPPILRP
jgi:glucan phosphoethanolaminetransferase (alkaline phosphatase superfamily)